MGWGLGRWYRYTGNLVTATLAVNVPLIFNKIFQNYPAKLCWVWSLLLSLMTAACPTLSWWRTTGQPWRTAPSSATTARAPGGRRRQRARCAPVRPACATSSSPTVSRPRTTVHHHYSASTERQELEMQQTQSFSHLEEGFELKNSNNKQTIFIFLK